MNLVKLQQSCVVGMGQQTIIVSCLIVHLYIPSTSTCATISGHLVSLSHADLLLLKQPYEPYRNVLLSTFHIALKNCNSITNNSQSDQ